MNLNAALRTLYTQEGSTLTYEQRIDVRSIDPDFAPYVTYQGETLRLQFPRECTAARHFHSPYPFKIITYRMLGMMQEREVRGEVAVEPDTVCLIYTRSHREFVLSFELTLTKRLHSNL